LKIFCAKLLKKLIQLKKNIFLTFFMHFYTILVDIRQVKRFNGYGKIASLYKDFYILLRLLNIKAISKKWTY
jgi:hypothetical protein